MIIIISRLLDNWRIIVIGNHCWFGEWVDIYIYGGRIGVVGNNKSNQSERSDQMMRELVIKKYR